MRHVLFVSVITVAAFTYASGQVRDLSPDKGQIEDLKGVIKVYVGTYDRSASLSTTRTIIETVRKRLPQINFVSLREEADVWLLFSEATSTETESDPGPSLDDRSAVKFVRHHPEVAGQRHRCPRTKPSETRQEIFGDGKIHRRQ